MLASPVHSDSVALDAGDGRVLTPPDLDYADLVLSDDARYALVRFRTEPGQRYPGAGQVFETEGWRALGERRAVGAAIGADEWLFAPDGKRLLGTRDYVRFTMFEPATLSPLWHLELARGEVVRAWRFSPDGSQLALGTVSGAVHLVDARDGRAALLPAAPPSSIYRIEFSRDGATLAAQARSGAIATWDVATRTPRADSLPAPHATHLRLRGDELYAVLDNQLRSWTLTLPAPHDSEALTGTARIRARLGFDGYAYDVRPESRIMVAGGRDGLVQLWRLPQPALQRARAAPLPARHLGFDGERLVAVDDANVVLRDARSGAARSWTFAHPEPVRLAELSFDGRRLVTVAGRTVRVLDPESGELLGEPIVLPQTPLRAEFARAAPVLAITTSAYDGDRFEESIHVVELEQPRLRGPAVRVEGPLGQFALDPRGRYALALGPKSARLQDIATVRVQLDGATARCAPTPGAGTPEAGSVRELAIADDGGSAWTLALSDDQERLTLQRWSLDDCRLLFSTSMRLIGRSVGLHALGAGVVAHQLVDERLTVFDGEGRRRDVPIGKLAGVMSEFAVSRDGGRVALATRNAVHLFDLERGERLSAALSAPIAGNDAIAKLAFSPDATRLLARTVRGRWLHWHLPVAARSGEELGQLTALLDPEGSEAGAAEGDAARTRELLRAAERTVDTTDHGAEPKVVSLSAAAGAEPDPRFVPLDLGPAINGPLNGAFPTMPGGYGDAPTLARGAQRFNGIDWRVDGAVQLSGGNIVSAVYPVLRESAPVAVPDLRVRRVHALVLMQVPMFSKAPLPFARVVLVDERGREFPLEILSRRDVATLHGFGRAAPSARVAWIGMPASIVREGYASSSDTMTNVYAVALDVPPEAGVVKRLRLEAPEGELQAPLFYAVTLERQADESPAVEGVASGR